MTLTIHASRGVRTAFALLALAAASLSSAAQEFHSLVLTPITGSTLSTDIVGGNQLRTGWGADLNLAQFDPTKGTLTNVSLVFEWSGTISGSVTNQSASVNSAVIDHQLLFDLTDRAVSTFYTTGQVGLDYSFSPTLAVGGSASVGPLSGAGKFNAPALPLTMFLGSGLLDLNLYAYGMTSQLGGGPIQTDVDTFAGVTAKLTYDYTPFSSPVPAPPAFMAMGLGALRLVRRRKGRDQA